MLLVDDLNDLGVPFTWRGRMGDMLRDCVWFDGSPRSLDSSMPKLQKHFTNIMARNSKKFMMIEVILSNLTGGFNTANVS